ncbi:hypothetical protein FPV67DRAFT_1009151, partial [Lyophyllum atratum]
MASLSDQIDRLSRHTRAIKNTAATTATTTTAYPFTHAVLSAHLGDLIRDVDPSELGLFSLPSSAAPTSGITRAEFSGATPLRKPPPRRDEAQKVKEIEPEIYAQAALKCIDRYHAIRPMPRAHAQVSIILERLTLVRENIQSLTETLQQAQSAEGPPLKSLLDDEEKRVQDLQARLAELQERKRNATSVQKATHSKKPAPTRLKPKQKAPPLPSSPQEDNFWNTPAAAARTLHFSDNLLDEQVDLGDITTTSFMSPTPSVKTGVTSPFMPPDDSFIYSPPVSTERHEEEETDDQEGEEDEEHDEEDEKTVVLRKPLPESRTPEPQTSHPASLPEVSIQESPTPFPSGTPGAIHGKVRVNSEVERITAKIWSTVGDIIMPGHPFNTTNHGVGSRPPRAKESIAHLQSLSALSPSPPPISPPASSVSSASAGGPTPPTSQQVLTAHLLLSLLASPPQFSLSLNKAKDLLASKASAGGGTGAVAQGTTRILYGCVAKRLLKIERGGGEQIVKFDV